MPKAAQQAKEYWWNYGLLQRHIDSSQWVEQTGGNSKTPPLILAKHLNPDKLVKIEQWRSWSADIEDYVENVVPGAKRVLTEIKKFDAWHAPGVPKSWNMEPKEDQNEDQKRPRVEKSILQKPLFYLSKSIVFESQGGQKALNNR